MKAIKGMEFCEALSYLIDFQGLEIKEFTEDSEDSSSLSMRQVERYKNGETKNLNKRVVIALCLALNLPLQISELLLEIAGFKLNTSEEDTLLLTILSTMRGRKFDEINSILTSRGFKPLTNTRI